MKYDYDERRLIDLPKIRLHDIPIRLHDRHSDY